MLPEKLRGNFPQYNPAAIWEKMPPGLDSYKLRSGLRLPDARN
jgi:hypothetical protein